MITTGDTRMSVMPQLAFPAPVQLPEPLAGLNAGLDTADKYAQLAQNEQMNPLRKQLAQLQVKQDQRNLLKPILGPTTQRVITQSRAVPPVFDQAGYDAAYKAVYDPAYQAEIDAGNAPDLAAQNAARTATEKVAPTTDAFWIPQSDVQDRFIQSDSTDLATGAPVTSTAFNEGAEDISDKAARAAAAAKNPWQKMESVGPDGKQHVYSWNSVTGAMIDHGVAGVAQSNIERNTSTGALNTLKGEQISDNMRYAAQTQQAKAVWASVIGHVPDQHELTQLAIESRDIGANIPLLALINRSASSYYIKSYMKAMHNPDPNFSGTAMDKLPEDPAIRKAILAEMAQIFKDAPALGASLDTANGIKVPGMTPGTSTDVPTISNPAVAGQAGVTVLPRVNFPAPVTAIPAPVVPATAPVTQPWWKEALDAINPTVTPHAPTRVPVSAPANVAPVSPVVTVPTSPSTYPGNTTSKSMRVSVRESNIPTITTQEDLDALNSGDPFYSPLYPGQLLHKR